MRYVCVASHRVGVVELRQNLSIYLRLDALSRGLQRVRGER
jgi:hypothetical protein